MLKWVSVLCVVGVCFSCASWRAIGSGTQMDVNAEPAKSSPLTSNRYSALAPGTAQVVVFYDGNDSENLIVELEYLRPNGTVGVLAHTHLAPFNRSIAMEQWNMFGSKFTGKISVRGTVPNGVIDGVAVGVFFKDHSRAHHVYKTAPLPNPTATFFGMWPLGMPIEEFSHKTQVTDPFILQQGYATLSGAALVGDGTFVMAGQ